MPRVVRDVIRIKRTLRPPYSEPPGVRIEPASSDTYPLAPSEKTPDVVEWQVIIVINTLPDLPVDLDRSTGTDSQSI